MSDVVSGRVPPQVGAALETHDPTATPADVSPIGDVDVAGLNLQVFPTGHSDAAVAFDPASGSATAGPHSDEVAERLACEKKIEGDSHFASYEFELARAAYEAGLGCVQQSPSVKANLLWTAAKAGLHVANGQQGMARRNSLITALERCRGAQEFYAANAFACAALESDMRRVMTELAALTL